MLLLEKIKMANNYFFKCSAITKGQTAKAVIEKMFGLHPENYLKWTCWSTDNDLKLF